MNEKYDIAVKAINDYLKRNERIFVCIDGRCAAGKTTLAFEIQKKFPCNVIHGDDFFLQPYQRTAERMSKCGENIDYERLVNEVLIPLKNGESATYRPFDCHTVSMKDIVTVKPEKVIIVEGSYCCNKHLFDFFDIHIFVDVDKQIQRQRIILRNGNNAEMFFSKWIPMEEEYFEKYNIKDKCEIKI